MSEPYIKLPEVGLTDDKGKHTLASTQWKNTKLIIGNNKPVANAVNILMHRLFDEESPIFIGWESISHAHQDFDLAIKILQEYRKDVEDVPENDQ